MDVDDVDQWLDDDGTVGRQTDALRDRGTSTGGRRVPWRWIVMAGVAIWVAAVAVVALGGGRAADEPGGEDGAAVAGVDGAGPASGAPALPDLMQPADATPTTLPPTASPPTSPPTTSPSTSASGPQATSAPAADDSAPAPGLPAGAEAGAIRALRQHLTTAGPPATYLEWATPVAARPLDAGIWLIEVEAVWLQDDAGQLDEAHLGTWAVPVDDGGHPLSPPWPLATAAPPPPPLEPPTGTARLIEVQQGLRAHGWHDVTAVAADPHALLADVVVALVQGTPPAGDATTGAIVWLVQGEDGALTPMGARP